MIGTQRTNDALENRLDETDRVVASYKATNQASPTSNPGLLCSLTRELPCL